MSLSIIVYLSNNGYPTGERLSIRGKIESKLVGLTVEHFAATTVQGEHFCDNFKIGILLRRIDFKTTRRLASCHVHKWNDKEFEDPDV